MGMKEYTEWWCKYPWHVSKITVPEDCGCEYCTFRRDSENLEWNS